MHKKQMKRQRIDNKKVDIDTKLYKESKNSGEHK